VQLKFQTAPELVAGIELACNGQKVSWNIAATWPRSSRASMRHRRLKAHVPADLKAVFDSAFASLTAARRDSHLN